ncbi:MAG: MFS transporter [Thiotrichales bacterium]|nr:MFS transporter [Thiotrichales bacterium]MCY4349204.1 MFS transporter [Thiotrichales bacterium]
MNSTAIVDSRPGRSATAAVILAACLIALIGFGTRSSFGLYLDPMTVANGWSRETFGLAMAIQNLLWGIGVPVAGAIADRYGPGLVIAIGAVIYGVGVAGMAVSDSGLALHLTAGLLVGVGVAFTSFSLALAAIARVVSPERRSLALGFGTAAGSLGQVLFSPFTQAFITNYGWYDSLVLVSFVTLIMIPLAFTLPGAGRTPGEAPSNQTMGEALGEAVTHRGYVLLTVGFFVCGFHVAFLTVHFPAYVTDLGLPAHVGAYALSIVGLLNIVGSFMAGIAGQRFSKKTSLSAIYFGRAVVIAALLAAPPSELTIYLFSTAMGLLWLSTVPLTSGIVAQVFGVKFMATLFGVVFLSHQIGSFLGVWLGGVLYDRTGSYDLMWWAGIFLGVFAAAIHLPIDEKPLARLRVRAAT